MDTLEETSFAFSSASLFTMYCLGSHHGSVAYPRRSSAIIPKVDEMIITRQRWREYECIGLSSVKLFQLSIFSQAHFDLFQQGGRLCIDALK